MRDEEFLDTLEDDPGNEIFCEYAETLRGRGDLKESLWVLLRGLNSSPSLHRGRLLLARVLYEAGFVVFAVRELEDLQSALPENELIGRLIERLGGGTKSEDDLPSLEETFGETEFDFSEFDLIDDDSEK